MSLKIGDLIVLKNLPDDFSSCMFNGSICIIIEVKKCGEFVCSAHLIGNKFCTTCFYRHEFDLINIPKKIKQIGSQI